MDMDMDMDLDMDMGHKQKKIILQLVTNKSPFYHYVLVKPKRGAGQIGNI